MSFKSHWKSGCSMSFRNIPCLYILSLHRLLVHAGKIQIDSQCWCYPFCQSIAIRKLYLFYISIISSLPFIREPTYNYIIPLPLPFNKDTFDSPSCSVYLRNTLKKLLFHFAPALFPFLRGQNRSKIFNGRRFFMCKGAWNNQKIPDYLRRSLILKF